MEPVSSAVELVRHVSSVMTTPAFASLMIVPALIGLSFGVRVAQVALAPSCIRTVAPQGPGRFSLVETAGLRGWPDPRGPGLET